MEKKLLIALVHPTKREWYEELSKHAKVYWIQDLSEQELDSLLPVIDSLIVHPWHERITRARLARMKNLKMIQCETGSVNWIPFENLDQRILVCNNAGGYGREVSEFALALLLAGAKRVVRFDNAIKHHVDESETTRDRANEVMTLEGASLGILGYGGIGKKAGELASAIGMKIHAYTRRRMRKKGVKFHVGREGLNEMLKECDAFLLSLPLTNLTQNIIGANELFLMKKNAVMVNVGRAELVDAHALYEHLRLNPGFTYATDVWWYEDGKETFNPELPFPSLRNFIGTPHVAGPSAFMTGSAVRPVVGNVLLYLTGKTPRNVIDRSEYTRKAQ